MSKTIVLATFGSLGDIHPFLAIAARLKARGHDPLLATSESYRGRAQALGIRFASIRPDLPEDHVKQRWAHPTKGTERFFREYLYPALGQSFDDLWQVCRDTDLLVSHVCMPAAPLVAEKIGLPWISTVLHPMGMFSAYDPPLLGQAPFLSKLRFLGPWFHRPLFFLVKRALNRWARPWHQMRARIGLHPTSANPLFEGQHSPRRVLALFSPHFARPQPDWPGHTLITGFPFLDDEYQGQLSPALANFLRNGPAPLVFSLGSAIVHDSGNFYQDSYRAATALNQRAVFLTSPALLPPLPSNMLASPYEPHTRLFPRCSLIIHHGGVGTTSVALRAGRPMLVVPHAHDQPDNAARIAKMGLGTYLPAGAGLTRGLKQILEDRAMEERARQMGQYIAAENGAQKACDEICAVVET